MYKIDMSRFYRSEYDTSFPINQQTVMKKLVGKNIVYSVQFILDDETHIDINGPQSSWHQFFFCLEKTDDDYVFHLFGTSQLEHSYSYPYYRIIPDYNHSFSNLSDFKKKIDSYLRNIDAFPTREIADFIWNYNRHTDHAILNDDNFKNQMSELGMNVFKLQRFNNRRIDKERKAFACAYEKYVHSDEYKKIIEERTIASDKLIEIEQKKEADRLHHLINLYGEKQGRLYHSIL
jgi:hypothetical protein